MDLSKAYDCISHDLLIATLYVYGLDNSALNLLHNYLSNRKCSVKINNFFSDWVNVVIRIPQSSSVLGLVLFNIFINPLALRNHQSSSRRSANLAANHQSVPPVTVRFFPYKILVSCWIALSFIWGERTKNKLSDWIIFKHGVCVAFPQNNKETEANSRLVSTISYGHC